MKEIIFFSRKKLNCIGFSQRLIIKKQKALATDNSLIFLVKPKWKQFAVHWLKPTAIQRGLDIGTANADNIILNILTFSLHEDTFSPDKGTFIPDKDTFSPAKRTFSPNKDTFGPTERTFSP